MSPLCQGNHHEAERFHMIPLTPQFFVLATWNPMSPFSGWGQGTEKGEKLVREKTWSIVLPDFPEPDGDIPFLQEICRRRGDEIFPGLVAGHPVADVGGA